MQKITEKTKKKVVKLHIQDGRTISSLVAEYGVCTATISNWMCTYREACQNNDAARSELELMQEVRKLRQELEESKKENKFLKISKMSA